MSGLGDRTPRPAAVTVVQPAIPHYRVDFFARLARHYGDAFRVCGSTLEVGALTARDTRWPWEQTLGPIRSLPGGLQWQDGVGEIPVAKGDRLIVWGAPRALSNLGLILKARMRGAKVIWWGHFLSPTSRPWRHALRIVLMRGVHGLLFYTEHEVEAYRATPAGARDPRPVGALNNGIDTVPIAARRAPYLAAERAPAAMFIGRLTEKSRLGLAFEALARPEARGLTLHVIGDGEDAAALRDKATGLGLAERVVWHGASTDEDQIAAVANRVRFFLYPGDVGLSLVHGLAYGLPAVIHESALDHMPEVAAFAPGVNGAAFRRGDAADLGRVVGALGNDMARLDRLSQAAVETVAQEFNTARMAERLVAFLDRIDQHRGRP